MPSLRVLNVDGNQRLDRLPAELATCPSLADVVCDGRAIRDPPAGVLERGTQAVLAYLMGNAAGWRDMPVLQQRRPAAVAVELAAAEVTADDAADAAPFPTPDASPTDADVLGDISKRLQLEQQRNRDELLQQLLRQQNDNDALVSELQLKRDGERSKLIEHIASGGHWNAHPS